MVFLVLCVESCVWHFVPAPCRVPYIDLPLVSLQTQTQDAIIGMCKSQVEISKPKIQDLPFL